MANRSDMYVGVNDTTNRTFYINQFLMSYSLLLHLLVTW